MRDISTIFIAKETKNLIIKDLESFLASRDFYIKRNIPYRRGVLLHGPPGTGKSSLISAIAKHLKRDLYVLNMKSINDDAMFTRLMSCISNNCILLIEDIDGYFDGRKSETKVNFSTFLNEISGVKAKEELILIITTNHLHKIDDAIMRSGRIDLRVEIGLPTSDLVNDYLSWFYNKAIDAVSGPVHYTMADVENICVQNKLDASKAIEKLISKASLIKTA